MKTLRILMVTLGTLIGAIGSTLMILGFFIDYATYVGYGMFGFVLGIALAMKGTEK